MEKSHELIIFSQDLEPICECQAGVYIGPCFYLTYTRLCLCAAACMFIFILLFLNPTEQNLHKNFFALISLPPFSLSVFPFILWGYSLRRLSTLSFLMIFFFRVATTVLFLRMYIFVGFNEFPSLVCWCTVIHLL